MISICRVCNCEIVDRHHLAKLCFSCGDHSKNGLNRTKSRSDSTTGLIGVLCTTKKNGRKVYQSKLTVNKKVVFCSNFKTAEEAHLAYLEAKKNLVIF